MKKVELIGEYKTSLGKTLIVKNDMPLNVGDNISVKDATYKIKKIILPTRPAQNDIVSVIV